MSVYSKTRNKTRKKRVLGRENIRNREVLYYRRSFCKKSNLVDLPHQGIGGPQLILHTRQHTLHPEFIQRAIFDFAQTRRSLPR